MTNYEKIEALSCAVARLLRECGETACQLGEGGYIVAVLPEGTVTIDDEVAWTDEGHNMDGNLIWTE